MMSPRSGEGGGKTTPDSSTPRTEIHHVYRTGDLNSLPLSPYIQHTIPPDTARVDLAPNGCESYVCQKRRPRTPYTGGNNQAAHGRMPSPADADTNGEGMECMSSVVSDDVDGDAGLL